MAYWDLMKNRSIKPVKQSHTSRSKSGMGDYHGTGIKQKIGRPISVMMENPSKTKKGKPPRALA